MGHDGLHDHPRAKAEAGSKQIESEMDRGVFVSRAETEATTLREALDRYLVEEEGRDLSAF